MAYKGDVVRLSVAVPKETDEKLVTLSKRMKISKTKLINQMIDTNIETLSQAYSLITNPELVSQMAKLSQTLQSCNIPGTESFTEINEKGILEMQEKFKDIPKDVENLLKKNK